MIILCKAVLRMRVRAQATYIRIHAYIYICHVHVTVTSSRFLSLTPRNFCVTQLCNNVCFLTGAQHDMYNLLQWGHIVAAELLFLSVHGWDQGCFSATGHSPRQLLYSLVSPIFCLHYFPQAKGSQCQTRAIYSCSSSGVATNSLFLPCWFSANKEAVLMQDKNILTDLSSTVCPTSGSSWRPTMKAVNELSLTHFCVLRVWLLLVCPLQSAVPKSYHALARALHLRPG